jgi:hypothetical protein
MSDPMPRQDPQIVERQPRQDRSFAARRDRFRIGILLFGLVALSIRSEASGFDLSAVTLVDISATTCFECWNDPSLPTVNIEATLSVIPVTGEYYDPYFQTFLHGNFLQVIGLTGLFDGLYPMSFVSPPDGAIPWLYTDFSPGYVYFMVGGTESRFINDHAYNLLQNSIDGNVNTPLHWNAAPTQVPEPSALTLFAVGVVGLAMFGFGRLRRVGEGVGRVRMGGTVGAHAIARAILRR